MDNICEFEIVVCGWPSVDSVVDFGGGHPNSSHWDTLTLHGALHLDAGDSIIFKTVHSFQPMP